MGVIKLKKAYEYEETAQQKVTDKLNTLQSDNEQGKRKTHEPSAVWDNPAVLCEDAEFTDENSRCFVMNDGTTRSFISGTPMNYYDATENRWQPIDNAIKENEGEYLAKFGKYSASISKIENGKTINVSGDNSKLEWEYIGRKTEASVSEISIPGLNCETANKTELQIENIPVGNIGEKAGKAIYSNIENATDLEYILSGNNIKENIIVKEKSENYKYIFALKTAGLKLRLSKDKTNLELYTEETRTDGGVEQKVKFTIPSPYMYDAAGEASDEVYYELIPTEKDGEYTFAVVASEDWINAENRVFPVVIDPQIITGSGNLFTKQILKRTLSCGCGSDCWRVAYGYADIKVFRDYNVEYKTKLTIKRSLMKVSDNHILGVKLVLKPNSEFSGWLKANNNVSRYYESVKGNFEIDITREFKKTTSDFDVEISAEQGGYIDGNFAFTTNGPVVEIEYLTNENTKPIKKNLSLAGIAAADVNLATGDMVTSFCDVSGDRSAGGLEIRHVYKKDSKDYLCGNNFRLNLQETFVKNGDGVSDADYVYTDAAGDKHGFREHYYYIDKNGKKTYILANKSIIAIDADGRLKYNGYNVYCDYKSASGLKALTRQDKLKHIDYYEQRSNEFKDICEKVKSYKEYLSQFILVNGSDGSEEKRLKDYINTADDFQEFINLANGCYIPLTEAECVNFKSLLLQRTSSSDDQASLIKEQISIVLGKKTQKIQSLQENYTEYALLLAKKKEYELKEPVNFLTDGKVYKGYNKDGMLVSVNDAYDNYAVIEYEPYYVEGKSGNRIARLYDNNNKVVSFAYTSDNHLSSITDARGNKTTYVYDSGANLLRAKYDTGENIEIAYSGNNISTIGEDKRKSLAEIIYFAGKPSVIKNYNTINGIPKDKSLDLLPLLDKVEFSFVQNDNSTMNYVTITADGAKERYYFNTDNNLKEYRLEEGGVMSKAEQYVYNPYWKGSTKQSDPKVVTTSTTKESLRGKTLTNFVFTAGDTETTTLDQFENPLKTTNSMVKLDAGGTNYLTVVTDRLYDDNQKLIEEVTTGTYSKDNKSIVSHTKYNYNYAGNIVRKETYVEGEEITKGKTVEETVYDNKGNVTKAFTYNTLDSSSKFYSSETEYDETGKTLANYDETGENKTKYGYKDGTTIVRETTLPNGSKFAYGHDADDTVTAITQSTEDGEENSMQKIYKYGQVVEVKSDNTTVGYEYDDKRRLSEVKLNGNVHSTFEYHENETLNGVTVDMVVEKKDDKEFTTYTDKRGRVIRAGFPEKVQIDYGYNAAGNVESMTETVDNNNVRSFAYTYNGLDKLTSYTEKDHGTDKHKETYVYDNYGKLTEVKHDSGFTYRYGYKSSIDGEIDNISIGENIVVKPKTDVNGRNTGKQVLFANTQVETESISYVKFGDHATNMPSSIVFGKKGVINCSASERLKYSYDKMGNISAIFKNGTLIVKYTYDTLNRIIREDNRTLKYTWIFAYDNNGNIITKKETEFTLKENTEDCVFTEHLYEYDGDELVYYDGKTCCYMAKTGKPSIYKNNNVYWSGVNVVEYGNNTFTYDACGRRLTKNNLVYTYDSNGKLIRQSNGLEFFYDHTGVAGMKYNGATYIYRKDVQGNIISLLDSNGRIVVKYAYDAWGYHTVYDSNGNINTDVNFIGNINPFRYRSYYYDTETKLYFLKTRYYDPEVGRFISPDSIEYLDPDTINGLNLYAYCNNNPISNVDPNGNKWWRWLLGAVIIIAAVALSVVTAGVAAPISAALGGGMLGAIAGGAIAGAIGGAITSFGIGVAVQGISNGFTNIDWRQVGIQTAIGAVSGAVLGGLGAGIKYARAASYLKANGITDVKSILKNFKGIPSLRTSNGVHAYRYYDNIVAFQKGRWLTNALTNNPIGDLVLYGNNANLVSKFMINGGTKYLVGRVAESSVNALQYFVANVNWLTLLQ